MGATNDANVSPPTPYHQILPPLTPPPKTVCTIPLIKLHTGRLTLCNACKKAGIRHIIRERLQPRTSEAAWPKLVKALYLVQPSGASHSPDFDRLVHHKVKDWVTRQVRELMKKEIALETYDEHEKGYQIVYPDWTRAWLLMQWDGDNFTEEEALRLLALYGEPEGWGVIVPPSIDTLPSILLTPNDDIYPDDSVTAIVSNDPAGEADFSIEELTDMLRQGAHELGRFNETIAMLSHQTVSSTMNVQDATDTMSRLRLELIKQITEVELLLDRRQCEVAGVSTGWPFLGHLWKFWIGDGTVVPGHVEEAG